MCLYLRTKDFNINLPSFRQGKVILLLPQHGPLKGPPRLGLRSLIKLS